MHTKKLLTVLFACISFTLVAQTGNYTVNMKGIADFKIGMKKTEVEKLLGQPLKLKNLLIKDEWTRDTILHKYKLSVSYRPESRLRHWCSSTSLRVSPLHVEFHSPLLHSSSPVSNDPPRLGRGLSHQT